MKKSIFISYSLESGYLEKKFIVETVNQFKDNNLAEDIWFDKDERSISSPCWLALRMEAAEKCRAAIIFLSNSFFDCQVSLREIHILLERQRNTPNSVQLFPILFDKLDVLKNHNDNDYSSLLSQAVDLTEAHSTKSTAEKASIVIGFLMGELEKVALVGLHSKSRSITPLSFEFTGEFRKRKICQWSVSNLQEWLFNIGIPEYCRQCMAEAAVDGFIILSLTENDFKLYFGMENRIVRKKLLQQILNVLDFEHKQEDNWHLKARAQRCKSNVIYLIYEPADVRLAQKLKTDLKEKALQVIHHNTTKLGHSKEEFININGPLLATASQVIVIMTENASTSPFVFQEVLFADWLGKKTTVVMFKNIWSSLRITLKVVLGQCPAVDFENQMYFESLDVLKYHIQPSQTVHTVVLEQSYLNKMTDGIKPFIHLASKRALTTTTRPNGSRPQIFISYQWDVMTKVEEIQQFLQQQGYVSWADISMAVDRHTCGGVSLSASSLSRSNTVLESLQSLIYRTMKSCYVVICCLTPKYLQSDNCIKDLSLASSLQKPIIPVILRYVSKENIHRSIGSFVSSETCVDLSNERLYRQNIATLLQKLQRFV